MQIGTCVYIDQFEQGPEKFAQLREMGFSTCQLLSWRPTGWTAEHADAMKGWITEYGITPSAFWCGWEGPSVWNFYDGPVTIEREIEGAQQDVDVLYARDYLKQIIFEVYVGVCHA